MKHTSWCTESSNSVEICSIVIPAHAGIHSSNQASYNGSPPPRERQVEELLLHTNANTVIPAHAGIHSSNQVSYNGSPPSRGRQVGKLTLYITLLLALFLLAQPTAMGEVDTVLPPVVDSLETVLVVHDTVRHVHDVHDSSKVTFYKELLDDQRHYNNWVLVGIAIVVTAILAGILIVNIGAFKLIFDSKIKDIERDIDNKLRIIKNDTESFMSSVTSMMTAREFLLKYYDTKKLKYIVWSLSSLVDSITYLLYISKGSDTLRNFLLYDLDGVIQCFRVPAVNMSQPHIDVLRKDLKLILSTDTWINVEQVQEKVNQIQEWLDSGDDALPMSAFTETNDNQSKSNSGSVESDEKHDNESNIT